ncbi:hypothetical protein ACYF6T_16300 [Streptomyces sp. 7R007]
MRDDEGWRVTVRRTAWWCGRPSLGARVAAVVTVLGALTALPARQATADASYGSSGSGASYGSYGFADDVRTVAGAKQTTDAPPLTPGADYRSSLPRAAKLYYRLDLDATSNTYVAVTAVPPAGSAPAATDGIRVSVQNADSHSCSYESASFGASHSPRPITAWGARTTAPANPVCEGGGTYYVVVERVGTADSPPGAWDLELTATTEAPLRKAGATNAPESWNSASPAPLTGEARRRQGGSGFSRAVSVGQGVWRADLRPGQTLFYKVPVDWGQQPYATAELGSTGSGSGYAVDALDLDLYNPVRAYVEDAGVGYDGRQKTATLAPVAPVAYVNRYGISAQVNGMRFAGAYYLAVHLAADVADEFGDGPFGLTLRVRVAGAAQSGPAYAGPSVPRGLFEVTSGEREAAADGGGSGGAGGGDLMRAVAVGGIGAGTLVLVVLGVWTVLGRRQMRARAQKPMA